ncbi:MAG: dephospho-CoA kinase [Longimicrobiales bacterium]
MLRIALTGNLGSGKSSVAEVWRRLGALVIDADELARRAVASGTAGYHRVVEAFGPTVLRADRTLDRAALRARVFGDATARRRLEAIVHPEVARLRAQEEARAAASGARLVVHEIPLLFEAGLADEFDVRVLVDAPEELRIGRVVASRGIDRAEAERIAAAQLPADDKRALVDFVIDNDADLAALEARAKEIWTELERRASG